MKKATYDGDKYYNLHIKFTETQDKKEVFV